ncbi:NAD(P)/FAD-dependent oxidoreductase [Thermococcus gammatolerans]|uniref:FAD-dependent pyridine nucleotide-disulphide oxidoreductase n=1 Tax=Thermococcus gammatolerans (strain DSM 15229 / JCM 11827 / EJ3) TaxID=593117 RepID=C5A1M5_THEGJ|nr:FAD-dependent oxidoreductase [Thermococcus gammatolerans]ACS34294.1 FAD-dependent pyridine nucleotide-disulphide oxidoreductase [Thermococcus gammatolerans EJ3]
MFPEIPMLSYDVVVVGGGPAGMAAAIRAKELGLKVLLLDENDYLGGILPQCIHPGFGLHYYREELTGPEFASRLAKRLVELGVEYRTAARVLEIKNYSDLEKVVIFTSPSGAYQVWAKAVIYAAGARERHAFEIGIVGDRVSGIYTAGEAQTLMDLYGIMPGKEIVIVGSGDVGLIMARRFALEGAKVKAVVELMPYPGGLARNVMILKDFNIPLYLSHKVVEVRGKGRVERVKVVRVDENLNEIPGSEFWIEADTLIISAGLVPSVKKLKKIGVEIDPATGGPVVNDRLETSVPGIFVAGNSLLINDLVDYVAEQGELAAEGAKEFIENGGIESRKWVKVEKGENVRLIAPHYLSGDRDVYLYLRVSKPMEDVELRIPEIGKRMKLPVVKPAEMLRIKLKAEEIRKAERLTVEVVKA